MATLEARQLSLAYDGKVVVEGLNYRVASGQITALVGPNGSGKSTALRGLARILLPWGGAALLDGEALHRRPTTEVARQIAILPQVPRAPDGLTVRELVGFGRYPYRQPFRGLGPADEEAIRRALARVGLSEFAERPVQQLSGGQAQRVWIAMALAQETAFLLLDEPTTYLDIAHQIEVLELLRQLNRNDGLTVVMAMHDLNLAARYSDWMVALRDGRLVAEGTPAQFMTEATIERVFDVQVEMVSVPSSGVKLFVPRAQGAAHGTF